MQPSFIIAAFLLLSSAAGHTVLTNLVVNGVVQTSCIRPHPSSKSNYPISDITNPNGLQSSDMTCGWPGKTSNSASKCSIPAGSTVGIEWHYEGKREGDTYIIAPSHKGPCFVYLARSDTGAGAVWFKIYEDGYDSSTKQFCVDKLIANRGVFEAKIPSDLAPGNYLLRAELIGLHEGFELGGAQPYVHCAEITITGSGTSIPSKNLVSFPGAYKANDAGIYFNIYNGFKSYPLPGPALYVAGSSSTPASSSTSTSSGRSSTSTSTTGRSSTSTGRASSTSTSTSRSASPTPSPTSPSASSSSSGGAKSGSCQNDGYMVCSSSSSYQTCTRGSWSDARSCQSGTKCSPSGNYIYCI